MRRRPAQHYPGMPRTLTRPFDPASMAHAIWNYKQSSLSKLNASDALNIIYFYDLEVISIDNWRVVSTKQTNHSDQESHQQKHVYFVPMTIEVCNRTYHWVCLKNTGCYAGRQREEVDNWACPGCADLKDEQKQKDTLNLSTKNSYT